MDGITATRLIKREYPQVAVVGLSVETKDYLVNSMLRVGASEVVTRRMQRVPCTVPFKRRWQPFNRFSSWKRRLSTDRRLKSLLNHEPSVWKHGMTAKRR